MNHRRHWQLAALALALAAGAARAQTGSGSSHSDSYSRPTGGCTSSSRVEDLCTAPATTWEFTTTREDGEARLRMQAGPGATGTCERITLRVGGTPVTLTARGAKVRVQSGPGDRGRLQASAERVSAGGARGEVLTLKGSVQVRLDRQGQVAQVLRGQEVILNLATCDLKVVGAAELSPPASPAGVSLDFGFPGRLPETRCEALVKTAANLDFGVPLVVPPGEKEKEQPQVFNFWFGHCR